MITPIITTHNLIKTRTGYNMSNMALSSARRRRTGPPVSQPPSQGSIPNQTQLQQAQMQRLMEIQKQRQQQQQQQQQQLPQAQLPYTQRPMSAPPLQPQSQSPLSQSRPIQIVKADTVVPPGYVKILSPNGVYHMESVETGSINFPYAEPHLAPTIILRNHDLDIIKLQGQYNDASNQLTHLTTILNRTTTAASATSTSSMPTSTSTSTSSSSSSSNMDELGEIEEHEIVFDEAVINKITENPGFISNTINHIMQNTNLADMLSQVETIKTENRELRSILNSQHEMMNAMNSLLFTLLNKMHTSSSSSASDSSDPCDTKDQCSETEPVPNFENENNTVLHGLEPITEEKEESNESVDPSVEPAIESTVESSEEHKTDGSGSGGDGGDVARDWLP